MLTDFVKTRMAKLGIRFFDPILFDSAIKSVCDPSDFSFFFCHFVNFLEMYCLSVRQMSMLAGEWRSRITSCLESLFVERFKTTTTVPSSSELKTWLESDMEKAMKLAGFSDPLEEKSTPHSGNQWFVETTKPHFVSQASFSSLLFCFVITTAVVDSFVTYFEQIGHQLLRNHDVPVPPLNASVNPKLLKEHLLIDISAKIDDQAKLDIVDDLIRRSYSAFLPERTGSQVRLITKHSVLCFVFDF